MPSRLHLDLACHALAAGGVIAYPTEAVWGLGCEPLNRHACKRVLSLKRRAGGKGFILIASDFAQAEPFTFVALGDAPYGDPAEVYAPYKVLIETINALSPKLVLHIGDTKSGSTPCSNEIIDQHINEPR